MTGARRWPRRLFIGLGIILGPVIVGVLLLQTSPVATWAVRQLVRFVPLNAGYALDVGRVSGNWLTRLQLENVRILHETRELGRIARLRATYDWRELAGGTTHLETVTIDGVRATAHRTAEGWDLANVLRPSTDTTSGGGKPVTIDSIAVGDAELAAAFGPDSVLRVRDLTLRLHGLAMGDTTLATIDTLAARIAPAAAEPRWLSVSGRGSATAADFRLDSVHLWNERSRISGRLVVPRNLDTPRAADRLVVALDAAPLSMADVASWVPSLRPDGDLRLALRITGEDRVAVGRLTGELDDIRLALDGRTTVGSGGPRDLQLKGTLRDLDLARLMAAGPAGRINVDLTAALRGNKPADADGQIDLVMTRSHVADVAIDRMTLRTTVVAGRADLALRGNVGGGAVSADGWARPFDSVPTYELTGDARGLPGTDSLVRQLVGADGSPVLAVHFKAAGSGATLDDLQLSGRADLAALRRGVREPLGNTPFTFADRRLALRPELRLAGGRITGLATVQVGDTISYEIRSGTIERVDLARLAGDTVVAPLSGRFALTGRGTVPDSAVVDARIELDELRYGQRQIEHVTAALRLDRGLAVIQAEGGVQGGRLALDVTTRPLDSTRTFVIRRGTLERVDVGALLGQPDYRGPVTLRMAGKGQWNDAVRRFDGRIDIEPSTLGQIEVRRGTLVAALNGDRATFDGSLLTNGGALLLTGNATGIGTSPAVTIERGHFDSLDLAVLFGRPPLAGRLNGQFSGAAQGQTLDSMRANFALDLQPSRFGETAIQRGRLAVDLDRGAIRGNADLESSDGRFQAQAALQTTSDSTGLASVGGTVTAAGGFRGVNIDTLLIALQPAAGRIVADTILLRSNVAIMDGGGALALRPTAAPTADTLRVIGMARDLAPATALAGLDTLSVDSARIDLAVTGPAGQWQVAGQADIQRLLYAGKQAEGVTLQASAMIDSAGLSGVAGKLNVGSAAVGKMQISELVATARYDSVVALDLSASVRDSVRLVTAIRGTAVGDTVRTMIERLDLTEGGRAWTLERPTQLIVRPRIELDSFALRAGDRRIFANGIVDMAGRSDLALQIDGLDLDILSELGLAPVPGRLDGNLRFAGPAATPTLAGRFGLTVRRGATDLGQITTDIDWNERGLKLDAVAAPRQGGRLTASGILPYQLTLAPTDTGANASMMRKIADTLAMLVESDSFDLAFFDPLLPPENARNLRGFLATRTRIGGTLDEARVDGNVRLTGVGVALPPLGLEYRGGELAGEFTGSELRISRLYLESDDDESLTAQGTVQFRPLTNPSLDLTATLQDFLISNSEILHTSARGELKLAGTLEKPSLTGGLRLGRTEVFQGAEGAPIAVKDVELSQRDLDELAQNFGAAALAKADAGPGLVERFRLDIDVRLPRNVWFRRRVSPRADIELSGEIKLKQEPGQEMQFFGEVEPTPGRGFLDVYGRNFRLTGGAIRLAGPVDSMTLDVTAQYQVPTQSGPDAGILIDVAAKGRADSLSLDFTAEPSMDQEDIIAYIVTGRPASENPLASQGGSASEAGKELAFGALSDKVASAAGEKLGLDVFQIKQDGLRGLTLTAGRYIAPRIFMSLQQPIQLSSGAQQAPGSNFGPGFELEYNMKRWLRANLRGGSLPPRFFFRTRYAY